MRLLLVTNDFPPRPGGIQQYLGNLVEAFPGEVRVLAPAESDDAGSGVIRADRRFMWPTRRVRRWVEEHIDRFRPDIVVLRGRGRCRWAGPSSCLQGGLADVARLRPGYH